MIIEDELRSSSARLGRTLDRLRLRHLQLVDSLSRTRSVGQTAVELHVTQSAATKILQDVEDLFGAPLFERLPRGMVPTPAGERIVRYARRILNDTRHAVDEVNSLGDGGAGLLTIGAIMASMPIVLPGALAELRARRPLLTVQLHATTSDEIMTLLEQRKVELGVCRLSDPTLATTLDFEPLFDEEYWVFVGHGHELAGRREVAFADLAELPWVLQPPGSPSRQVLEAGFAAAGLTMPPSRIETTSRFATLNLVQHGGMVGMLPSTILTDAVDRSALVRLPLDSLRSSTGYGLVRRKGEPLSDPATELAELIRARSDSRAATPRTP